jgi:hypothetical protein
MGKFYIKPCPDCGSPAEAFKYWDAFRVECTNIEKCKTVTENGATGHNRPAAIRNWNTGKHGYQWTPLE